MFHCSRGFLCFSVAELLERIRLVHWAFVLCSDGIEGQSGNISTVLPISSNEVISSLSIAHPLFVGKIMGFFNFCIFPTQACSQVMLSPDRSNIGGTVDAVR